MKGVVARCTLAGLVAATVVGSGAAAGPAGNGRILVLEAADLFTVDPDGSDRRRLTADGRNGLGVFSPDGQRVAFVKSDGSPPRDLYVVNAHGTGGARLLATHPRTTGDHSVVAIAWSPDSARIAYLFGDAPHIRVIDARDGTPFPLAQSGDPAPQGRRLEWSPDGTELLYDAHDDFWAKPLDGRPARRVVSLEGADAGATWSPDGSRIAFVHAASERAGGVYVVRRDGADLRHVAATGTVPVGNVRWTPDGTAVVFDAVRVTGVGPRNIALTTSSILIARADGSVVRHVRDHARAPVPSPDNSQLLVQPLTAVPDGWEAFKPGVYVINTDGNCLTLVTTGTALDWGRAPASPASAPLDCVDLVLSASAPGLTGLRGAPYALTVRNEGTRAATDVRLELSFDADVRFVLEREARRVCSANGVVLTCRIGLLERGERIDLPVLARPSTAVLLTAEITVSSDGRDSDPTSNEASLRTRVFPCWIAGTDSADRIHGTSAGEEICARAGDDVVHAHAGADRIDGGWGRDSLTGGT
ncbi:MAG: hypothetical protein M3321_01170, partial [Actinomycetota bacterium]|nr:hypothetical protein [Actinomycetota bacterium]